MNTDYNSVGLITPLERTYLLGFIKEDLEARLEALLLMEAEYNNS